MKKLGNKIIYELYPISFNDSNDDGYGDLLGIIEKLDYLELLGIDLIWITPIFKSPKNDNGYDIANYLEIDPIFGTMQDVELLIAEAKKRNIGIIFDMVFNHVSTESEWFKKALKGSKKYQNYFYVVKSDDLNNKPTNWVSKFGGSAWKYQKEFNGYYLHLFSDTQVDLNWKNFELRSELINILNFWIKKGVAGFRFDVINLIGKPDKFISSFDFGKSLYTDHISVHKYLKEINAKSFGKYNNLITVGEMSSTTIENSIKYSCPDEHELDMVFSFHHLKVDYRNEKKWTKMDWDKKKFKDSITEWQTKLQNKGWNALFLNNHDQPRVNSRYGDTKNYWFESSTLFATLIFTLQGTVFIYQGEEIGMTNPEFDSIEKYRDIESINAFNELKNLKMNEKEIFEILKSKSRDNARTPMQWSNDKNAGFSGHKPWINVAKNFKKVNVKNQINDPQSVFNFYRKLIKLRKSNSALYEGKIDFIDSDESIFVYKRISDHQNIIILLNLSSLKFEYSFKNFKIKKQLINNYHWYSENELYPFQAIVFEIEK